MSIRGGLFVAGSFLFILPVIASAELPKAEQLCINKINKDAIKVQAAQLKVGDGCVKDAVKTGSDGDACMEADVKDKVGKKRAKTVDDETKKCSGSPPAVFYTSSLIANDAAEAAGKALHRDVFGAGLSALQLCDTNPNECQCQIKVINRVTKIERALGKIWLKCKKAAMKNGKEPFAVGGAEINAELEQCVTNGVLPGGLSVESDTKGKVDNAIGQLQTTAEQFCAAGTEDEFAGGACAGFSTPPTIDGAGLATCLSNQAKCRFCEMVNTVDALSIDCDGWVGIACP